MSPYLDSVSTALSRSRWKAVRLGPPWVISSAAHCPSDGSDTRPAHWLRTVPAGDDTAMLAIWARSAGTSDARAEISIPRTEAIAITATVGMNNRLASQCGHEVNSIDK